jgi:hypothetical protein
MGEDLFACRRIALRIRCKRYGKHPGGRQHNRVGRSADRGEGVHRQAPG